MYILTDEPDEPGPLKTAFDVLDDTFGTEEFSREKAIAALDTIDLRYSSDTFDRMVRLGYISKA